MARTLLIVDDINGNREILKKILGDDYNFLEASNGQEAMALLTQNYKLISAVLLDLAMPVMNGFDVLMLMRENASLSNIPVIIMTGNVETDSEVKALSLGAIDYISKPYNPAIIKQRIRNTISLRENAAAVNALQRDALTGLYNREAFFERVPDFLQSHEPGYYVMACFDIDNFKTVNDQYGADEGDRILRHIGEVINHDITGMNGLCGRITADNFAVLYPAKFISEGHDFMSKMRAALSVYKDTHASLTFSIGRYLVTEPSLSASTIYDRAYLAKQSVKGRYDQHIAYYDESMRDRVMREQEITREMEAALASCQFEIYLQPQYNHSTGALIGSEALAHWRHPEKGLIKPNDFIPVFEKNGFIYALDKYVWEQACLCLRKWIDEGQSPLPISVNISRYDLFREDLIEVINGLISRYGIAVDLLRLEITESAFAESTAQIVTVVKRLIACGFTVEIDDFGSGYSSLNTLKDVPAQVVKLDMRFLDNNENSHRGGNILEAIVRMTKWLGMSVIAEGVETAEQANFLKSIGCTYVQGYLYAHPMPVQDYEALCRRRIKENHLNKLVTVDNMDNNTFWDPASMDTLIFNSFVGGACVFEYHNGQLELLRVNDKYMQELAGDISVEDMYAYKLTDSIDKDNMDTLLKNIRHAIETGKESTCEICHKGLYGIKAARYIRSTVRMIARAGNSCLIYCTIINTTAQREAEKKEREAAKRLQTVMDNMDCGITATVLRNGKAEYLLANDKYYKLLGYTEAQFRKEIGNDAYATLHPDDRECIIAAAELADRTGQKSALEYRALRRDGSVVRLSCLISMTTFDGVDGRVQICTYTDVTAERYLEIEFLDNLPCGAAIYEYDGQSFDVVHINKRYWELVGRNEASYAGASVLTAVHQDDIPIIERELASAIEQGRNDSCNIRIRYGENEYRPFNVAGRIIHNDNGKYSLYISYTPITDETPLTLELLQKQYDLTIENMPDFVAKWLFADNDVFLLEANQKYLDFMHISAENAYNKSIIYGFSEKEKREVLDAFYAKEKNREPLHITSRACKANGEECYITVNASFFEEKDGNSIYYGTLTDVTELVEAQRRLAVSEKEYRIAASLSNYSLIRYDIRNKAISSLARGNTDIDFSSYSENVAEKAIENGLIAPESVNTIRRIFADIDSGREGKNEIVVFLNEDGARRWVQMGYSITRDDNGKPATAIISIEDKTQLKQATEMFNVSSTFLDHSENAKKLLVLNLTSGSVEYESQGAHGFIAKSLDDMDIDDIGRDAIKRIVYPEDREACVEFFLPKNVLADFLNGKTENYIEFRTRNNSGELRWMGVHSRVVRDEYTGEIKEYLVFSDIHNLKMAEFDLQKRAMTDPLTGLMNRKVFEDKVRAIFAAKKENDNLFTAIIMLDVDKLKEINDTFGHDAGDAALRTVASRVQRNLHKNDMVARFGGDEFVLLMPNLRSAELIEQRCENICRCIRHEGTNGRHVTGSVGFAICPQDGSDYKTLLKKADTAMYLAKTSGGNRCVRYQEE